MNEKNLTTPEGVHVIFDDDNDVHGFTDEELEGENIEVIQKSLKNYCKGDGTQ